MLVVGFSSRVACMQYTYLVQLLVMVNFIKWKDCKETSILVNLHFHRVTETSVNFLNRHVAIVIFLQQNYYSYSLLTNELTSSEAWSWWASGCTWLVNSRRGHRTMEAWRSNNHLCFDSRYVDCYWHLLTKYIYIIHIGTFAVHFQSYLMMLRLNQNLIWIEKMFSYLKFCLSLDFTQLQIFLSLTFSCRIYLIK